MGTVGSLSPEQLLSFHSKGFLVMESFATTEAVRGMVECMEELVDGFDCSATASIFSTTNQKQTTDNYFFESAEKISFFFEEKAFGDDGKLKQPKQLSINKVGHALHEINPVFKKFCTSEKISSLFSSLNYRRPVIIQSMYIFKQPGIGGEVVPHQDNSFLYTQPPSCTGLWLALEDATITNGCLWAIPGSHKKVKAGSLVVIHGDLVHQSFENTSSKSRHALSLHAVETDCCTWAGDNWIRRKEEPEPLYVS